MARRCSLDVSWHLPIRGRLEYSRVLVTKHFAASDSTSTTARSGGARTKFRSPARRRRCCGACSRSAGSWVSKSAIMSAVWPDTHVQPDNIKVLVREIRQALGDGPEARHVHQVRARPRLLVHRRRVARRPHRRWPRPCAIARRADLRQSRTRSSPRSPMRSTRCAPRPGGWCSSPVNTAPGRPRSVTRSFERLTPPVPCASATATASIASCRTNPTTPFLDALIALDRRHPGFVPRILAQHAPSWLALFPQWIGSGRDHRARRPDVRRARRRARRHLPRSAPYPHPRGSPVGRRRHDQRAGAAGREPASLEAAHRRHLLRRRVDGGRAGRSIGCGPPPRSRRGRRRSRSAA